MRTNIDTRTNSKFSKSSLNYKFCQVMSPTSLLADIDEIKTVTCLCSPSEDMLDAHRVMDMSPSRLTAASAAAAVHGVGV